MVPMILRALLMSLYTPKSSLAVSPSSQPRHQWRIKSILHLVHPALHYGQAWICLGAWIAFTNLLPTEDACVISTKATHEIEMGLIVFPPKKKERNL